jgi:hypothetical protein
MESGRKTLRSLCLLTVFTTCSLSAFAAHPPRPQPVATLALSATHRSTLEESTWTSVTFLSETSIAVGLCRQNCSGKVCSLRLVRWESGALGAVAQTPRFEYGASLHPASEGQILAGFWLPSALYSADLSTRRELPKRLSHISRSGRTVSESATGSWKLYRLSDKLEPLREGEGELRSVSDEVLVIQEGKVIRVETVEGKRLGSFSVADELLGFHAALLGNNKLSLADCRRTVRVVDFAGKRQRKIHQDGLCADGDTTSSGDGRRILFDVVNHQASGLKAALEGIRTITSFGMVGAEAVNHEEVRVFDTVTGASCFDWHRSFPSTYDRVSSAAISPSGEYVAMAAEPTLSIYRLPADCGVLRSPQHKDK